MSRGDYAPDEDGVVAEILRHLAEIGAGRTSITDDDLANAPTDVMRELLVGLLTLHEDLQYEQSLRAGAEQQSDRLVADLRAAVTARDEFLSIASHELRTPLSTLKLQTAGLSRWLSQASLPEHEPHLLKHFAVIDRQVARLEKLTTELLDVSRISSGRLELHREPFESRGPRSRDSRAVPRRPGARVLVHRVRERSECRRRMGSLPDRPGRVEPGRERDSLRRR